ncbi:MAG: hypothetical protein LBB21_02675 [Holosporaceae bacterium]|jgi:hypothetical protein|nr:hypothetical protein [Holosporaceae bacterium]
MKFTFVLLLMVACSDDNSFERGKDCTAHEIYVQLINLLQQGSEEGISEELMQKNIFGI